jgi:CheY-like chemotaxis protein
MAAGFFRYLTKPIKVDELLDTLNLALAVASGPHLLAPGAA